ncbi:hypothetical protein AMS68_007962 [Peltaster fructicola]|uniref:Uncharacterized protein n=1 Tax=Peltaster fructicola TaxID=286661 RepID=A0A6H0Y6B8_9PEZI|nr:hypothetical protein AMS68_007962 [Peltaster fructicola]
MASRRRAKSQDPERAARAKKLDVLLEKIRNEFQKDAQLLPYSKFSRIKLKDENSTARLKKFDSYAPDKDTVQQLSQKKDELMANPAKFLPHGTDRANGPMSFALSIWQDTRSDYTKAFGREGHAAVSLLREQAASEKLAAKDIERLVQCYRDAHHKFGHLESRFGEGVCLVLGTSLKISYYWARIRRQLVASSSTSTLPDSGSLCPQSSHYRLERVPGLRSIRVRGLFWIAIFVMYAHPGNSKHILLTAIGMIEMAQDPDAKRTLSDILQDHASTELTPDSMISSVGTGEKTRYRTNSRLTASSSSSSSRTAAPESTRVTAADARTTSPAIEEKLPLYRAKLQQLETQGGGRVSFEEAVNVSLNPHQWQTSMRYNDKRWTATASSIKRAQHMICKDICNAMQIWF